MRKLGRPRNDYNNMPELLKTLSLVCRDSKIRRLDDAVKAQLVCFLQSPADQGAASSFALVLWVNNEEIERFRPVSQNSSKAAL